MTNLDSAVRVAILTTLALSVPLRAQVSVAIGSRCSLVVVNKIDLDVGGDWTNAGVFAPGAGVISFDGGTGDQTIANPSGETFFGVRVNKQSGSVVLANAVTVNDTLRLLGGHIKLNGQVLTLGPHAFISEALGNTVCGDSGFLTTTRSLGVPCALNVGGLGMIITSASDLGLTTVRRRHAACTGGGNYGIKRSYTVSPTNNTCLNAVFLFTYDHNELNGLPEEKLTLFQWKDNGTAWEAAGGTLDTVHNTITLTGVNSFSQWTAASSSAPLPIQLASFTASITREGFVRLDWMTLSEINSYGFEILRSTDSLEAYATLPNGRVPGHGTTNEPHTYAFVDSTVHIGFWFYRLKQTDLDGTVHTMSPISVNVLTVVNADLIPARFALQQNYPNPFNPTTQIPYEIPVGTRHAVSLRVYDVLGREVATLVDEVKQPGTYAVKFDGSGLASGVYFYRLSVSPEARRDLVPTTGRDGQAGSFVDVKRMLLVR